MVNKKWVEGQSEDDEVSLSVGSQRWVDIATRASAAAPESLDLIHVMDREGDSYKLMAHLVALGDSFVIRAQHNRSLETATGRLFDSIPDSAFELEREVPLSRRGRKRLPDARKRNPARKSRVAKVVIRATIIEVKRSSGLAATNRPSMSLSFVEVIEKDPPVGEKAVHWRILSTLPVDTQEQTTRVVDIYRKRWLIEEFFKALKTGCSAEKRQRTLAFWPLEYHCNVGAYRLENPRIASRFSKSQACTLRDCRR